jgi:hypothetical protein
MSLKLKDLADSAAARVTKKIPPEISERSLKVVENKCRKNARFQACHYVDENKQVIYGLPSCL